jgi:hypothetical protein
MRKLMCKQLEGPSVQEVLDGFNERHQEFGIESESDIVSVSVMRSVGSLASVISEVEVVIVYWENGT